MEIIIPLEIRSAIRAELERFEGKYDIHILYCAEAGSRSWGIPSADADYDVRFVYAQNLPSRYVGDPGMITEHIEVKKQVENAVLDMKGVDVREAHRLLCMGESNVYEWLASDIVYTQDYDRMWVLEMAAQDCFDVGSLARNYYGIAKKIFNNDIRWEDHVKVKKYLYALRAILCCRYVLINRSPVPLELKKLVEYFPYSTQDELDELIHSRSDTVDNIEIDKSRKLEDKITEQFSELETLMRGVWKNNEGVTKIANQILLNFVMLEEEQRSESLT